MKIYIKYMVSARCKIAVNEILQQMGLHFIVVGLGEVNLMEHMSEEKRQQLKTALNIIGFDLVDDRKAVLIEKIKNLIIETIHYSAERMTFNFSTFLSKKLEYDYTYMANLFSDLQGITIEQFIIAHKVERVKELIIYGELNMTEIAWKMNYSSVAHLSNQFKKVTGLSPTHFKQLKIKKRSPLEDIGN